MGNAEVAETFAEPSLSDAPLCKQCQGHGGIADVFWGVCFKIIYLTWCKLQFKLVNFERSFRAFISRPVLSEGSWSSNAGDMKSRGLAQNLMRSRNQRAPLDLRSSASTYTVCHWPLATGQASPWHSYMDRT